VRAAAHAGRVLHAISELGAASQTFVTDRMLELERLGWEAWVATRRARDPGGIEFPPAERVLVARRWRDRGRAVLRPGRLLRSRSWWLERPIAAVRPEVIHAHFGWSALDALFAARRHRIPLIAGLHGYDVTVLPRYGLGYDGMPAADHRGPAPPPRVAPGIYDELFEEARHVLVVSQYLRHRLEQLGYSREVAVVPSGIRLELFPFRGPRPRGPDYRLLFVGRLVPYKGLDVLLSALGEVAARVPGIALEVVGDGPLRARYARLAEELGIGASVTFRGAQPRAGVLSALRGADVLVAPSRTTAFGQAEGLGNVIKEALAVGVAVAASDNGGIPETLPPEMRSDLVPEGDPGALADRLLALWAGRSGWGERSERGRRWVERHFDWRAIAPRIAALYSDAAGGGSRRLIY
jgi:glycosyltransferase involved in cell wall biosynthesis